MQNITFSSTKDLKIFFNDKKFTKILIICGKNSYKNSGAYKIINELTKDKEIYIYYKQSFFTEYLELNKIIQTIKKYSPDLIVAIGGGSVIDYAKISNVLIDCEDIK